jgi:hypothetical protein
MRTAVIISHQLLITFPNASLRVLVGFFLTMTLTMTDFFSFSSALMLVLVLGIWQAIAGSESPVA